MHAFISGQRFDCVASNSAARILEKAESCHQTAILMSPPSMKVNIRNSCRPRRDFMYPCSSRTKVLSGGRSMILVRWWSKQLATLPSKAYTRMYWSFLEFATIVADAVLRHYIPAAAYSQSKIRQILQSSRDTKRRALRTMRFVFNKVDANARQSC